MDIIGVNIPIEDAIGNINRIAKLENLCRDMYETMHYLDPRHVYDYYTKRMTDLGLLEGEQNE